MKLLQILPLLLSASLLVAQGPAGGRGGAGAPAGPPGGRGGPGGPGAPAGGGPGGRGGAPAGPAAIIDFSGLWTGNMQEDSMERGAGPELVDYAGFPINEAGRL